jgi:hypothetical protein
MSPVTNEQISAVELDLSQNKLEGGVPTSIFEMSKLGKVLVGGLPGGLFAFNPVSYTVLPSLRRTPAPG